jgi:hypothetical protein
LVLACRTLRRLTGPVGAAARLYPGEDQPIFDSAAFARVGRAEALLDATLRAGASALLPAVLPKGLAAAVRRAERSDVLVAPRLIGRFGERGA